MSDENDARRSDDGLLSIEAPDPGTLRVVGEVDLSNARVLADAVRSATAEGGEIRVDLSRCSYLGSEGIAVLVDAWRTVGERGRVVLVSPRGAVRRVLDLAGFANLPNVQVEGLDED